MARFSTLTKLTTALIAAATLTIGCGTENSPVASNEPTITHTEDGRTLFSFSPQATQQAAKTTAIPAEGRTISKVFDANHNGMEIFDNNGTDHQLDDIIVFFTIPDHALDHSVEISMTVYGNTLEDMVIAFEPGGLNFLHHATLGLHLGHNLVHTPLDQLAAWHEHDDGSVEEADIFWLRVTHAKVKMKIAVPGFSRYSPGGGWKPVAQPYTGTMYQTNSRYSSGGGW